MNLQYITKLFVLLMLAPLFVFAEEDEVMAEVQIMMQDRQKMEDLSKSDANVKRANDFVNQVVGEGKEKDELLKISADVMGELAQKHKGDISAMQADLINALKDPKKFLESLSPEQKKQIRTLANQVESKNVPLAQPKP